ncbi:MAG TPA: hypothetical protein PL081_00830 [Pseudomonadales bacterium]|jgi:hypothetical protein|nr:hypothetical protein [Pseudomonadales bacterium]HNL23154.1 hypothetical protein [Pseudomonadales bacterium]
MTRDRLATATQRAQALADRFSAHDGREPYTAIGELVTLLTGLQS